MENASKALIIAGAILISIIIIGLGVYFVTMARESMSSVNLDQQVLDSHNGPFVQYFKNAASASEVKALISMVRSNNLKVDTQGSDAEGADNDESTKVYIAFKSGSTTTIYGDGATNTLSALSGKIKAGKQYKIYDNDSTKDGKPTGEDTASYYRSGYIRCILIDELTKN